MVDAARQMLDELMGRNRNLHPSEAPRKISWDDPDYCQYYVVKFCPHDLFINTRADLGPCTQIHDDEAKRLYEEARPSSRKRQYEDEFLRFCNNMLNDVDRKIQKGKQRLLLMNRDQPTPIIPISKYQEQLNNMNARIKKLLSEAEEAGIRGDVDQAKDLMALCEQLRDEKEAFVAQHEQQQLNNQTNGVLKEGVTTDPSESSSEKPEAEKPTKIEEPGTASGSSEKKLPAWMQEFGALPEKQMEVCETCGAFLIVGDAQQRIEDHLMGKQHLGYSRLRKAVEEVHERRLKNREEEERKRREEREQRSSQRSYSHHEERRRDHSDHRDRDRDRDRDHRERSREHSSRHSADRHRHHHKSSHRRRSHSRSSHRRGSRDRYSRSRSRSRSSRSHSRY